MGRHFGPGSNRNFGGGVVRLKATSKQITFALALMRKKGVPCQWMCSTHKQFGASMRERSGRVEDWLKSMTKARISGLIEELQAMEDA